MKAYRISSLGLAASLMVVAPVAAQAQVADSSPHAMRSSSFLGQRASTPTAGADKLRGSRGGAGIFIGAGALVFIILGIVVLSSDGGTRPTSP